MVQAKLPFEQIPEAVITRFHSLTRKSGNCLIWTKTPSWQGYGWFSFRLNGADYRYYAHVFSLFLFQKKWPKQALHTCNIRMCVNHEHLYDGTPMDNIKDTISAGNFPSGERSSLARLSQGEVDEIREMRKMGIQINALAIAYEVDRHTISRIIHRQTWKD